MSNRQMLSFHPAKIHPMDVWSIPAIIDPKGTLRKCPHSVYWPEGDEICFFCSWCNPDGAIAGSWGQKIVLPRYARLQADAGRLYANKREPNACPACRSYVHIAESETKRRCADCDCVYEVRPPVHSGEAPYISPYDQPCLLGAA